MAAGFLNLKKIDPVALVISPKWKNCKPKNCSDIYDIPLTPNKPHGKGANAQIEVIDMNIYEPAAKMAAFRVASKERLLHWIHCLTFRYHIELGGNEDYLVEWTDKLSKRSDKIHDEIQIRILKNDDSNQKFITIHMFLTTFLVTIQGTLFTKWVSEEFEYLKLIVEASLEQTLEKELQNTPKKTLSVDPLSPLSLDHHQMEKVVPRLVAPKSPADIFQSPMRHPSYMPLQNIEANLFKMLQAFEEKLDKLSVSVNSIQNQIQTSYSTK